jgi:methanol metabolism-related c-type cytochrome
VTGKWPASFLTVIVFGGLSLSATGEDLPEIPPMVTLPDGSKTQEGSTDESGKWVLPDGTISYHVKKDGGLDWYTYSGFKRYHDAGGCTQCHGQAGMGSTFGPGLVESLKTMDYATFLDIVANGRIIRKEGGAPSVMPALRGNRNVMCFIEDIYTYLRGRSQGAVNEFRPNARARDPKPAQAKVYEKECFG